MCLRIYIFIHVYVYNYIRFSQNECLSFLVCTPGAIDVALAERPTCPMGAVIMHIGIETSTMQTWDQTKKSWVCVFLCGYKIVWQDQRLMAGSSRPLVACYLCTFTQI